MSAHELHLGGIDWISNYVCVTWEHCSYIVRRHPAHPKGHAVDGHWTLKEARRIARRMTR